LPRIVQFSDGFTSASAPVVSGGSQENYTLLNNQTGTNITGFILDSNLYKSAFIDAEIERNGSSSYRQTIQIQLYFDGSDWNLTTGNSSGDDILNPSISSPEMITLFIDSLGQVSYDSGNLAGHTSSKLKLSIVRISV
jgi:hypothetical protein